MSWPIGNIDTGLQATYFAHWLSAFCVGINERQDCLALTETAFEYNEDGDSKSRPQPEDFQGLKLHGTKINEILTDIQTAITALVPANRWVPDMETETTTTLAAILTDAGLGSFPVSANVWNANDWARIYGVLERLLYAKIWPTVVNDSWYTTLGTGANASGLTDAWNDAVSNLHIHSGTSGSLGTYISHSVNYQSSNFPFNFARLNTTGQFTFTTDIYKGTVGNGYADFLCSASVAPQPVSVAKSFTFNGSTNSITNGTTYKLSANWNVATNTNIYFTVLNTDIPISSLLSGQTCYRTVSLSNGTSSNTFFLLNLSSELTDQAV